MEVVHKLMPFYKTFILKVLFKNGLRITNEKAIKAVEMALCGDVNTWLVSLLCKENILAIGLTGKDARTIIAQKNVDQELGFVGDITKVDPTLCNILLKIIIIFLYLLP